MKFNLTTLTMNHWFDEYNEKYFDGELIRPIFQIKKTKSYLGKAFCIQNKVILSTYLDRTEFEYQNTFIHEMIHLWQWMKYHHANHGYTFKKKAAEINEDGWKIQRCSATNGAQPTIMKKNTIYVATFNHLNRNCFSKINDKYCYSAYKKFAKSKGVTNVKLYRCDNSVALDRYPSITKSTRYFYGENAEKVFGPAIKNGTEIEFMTTKHNNSTLLSTYNN